MARAPFCGIGEAVTVLEVIQRSTDFLAKKGVDSPRLQIELLLAHALKIPRLNLYLNFARPLSETEIDAVRQMVKRRGHREPLQHITGSTSFCGLELKVTPAVLVPRPETELLAERAWKFLNERAGQSGPVTALDFGTGSGCLAVALAVNAPAVRFRAVDVSEAALEVARENAAAHHLSDRIQFGCGNGFDALPGGARFDLIVSNPPYIPSREIETLQPEVRDFDPRLALDGGEDGLGFYRALASKAKSFLRPEGKLMLEFGDGQEERIRTLFEDHTWTIESVECDHSGRPRIIVARPSGF
ncbi:MAG: peptide chain release factor N(5)-glutamine methyltransferase [Verrucomicrobia bacterium]|nr:peptide chain release factor N(5)-glutamine methyltransferase [Verrucomicrobiota bacterium]